ncbi:hypothetical protein [Mesorhizobium sp. M0029]|uniref:hypothetical protein n=1 Tax=Mesorhizobium sp. M0029 TaxID=2956850 RepID=UPI00333BA21A
MGENNLCDQSQERGVMVSHMPMSSDDLAELNAELMAPGEADGEAVLDDYMSLAEELLAGTDDGVASRTADTEPALVKRLLHGLYASAEYHRLRSERFLEALRRLRIAAGVKVY